MKKITLIVLALAMGTTLTAFFFPHHRPMPIKPALVVADTIASALTVPWDICFLPNGDMLFTERTGKVRLYKDHQLQEQPVLVIPDVWVNGKMGLLGMCLHPDFAKVPLLYLAYNYKEGNETFLRVVSYTYKEQTLTDPHTLIEHIPGVFNHTGSRLRFGPDRKLYITTGDADVPRLAQDLKLYNGKILRLNADGSIPADNPFVHNDTALHAIWSYGHRNPQGIAFQPGTGRLYSSEHGPTGGDEINLITKGKNYGWPVIHHRDQREGMISPLLEFSPSIGPAEALFYSGKAFPTFKGKLLVGCMRGEAILAVTIGPNKISQYQFLLKNKYGRIRAVTEGPDGSLYFSTSQVDPPESRLSPGDKGFDMIVRIRPAAASETANTFPLESTDALTDAIPVYNTTAKTTKPAIRQPAALYGQLCASCHGANMEGKDKVPSLTDKEWINGGSQSAVEKSIRTGIVAKGMPAWESVLSNEEIKAMALYILKQKK